MSHFLSFAKGALAMFWLVALVNLAYPLGELHRPILLLSGVLVLVHAAEILLLNGRLKARPAPWLSASRCCCSASCTCVASADLPRLYSRRGHRPRRAVRCAGSGTGNPPASAGEAGTAQEAPCVVCFPC